MMRATREWQLWSTTARLVVDREDALEDALEIAHRELARIDFVASRFRTDSEVNRIAARQPSGVTVSGLLAVLIRRGLEAAQLTGGLVDPTLGRSMNGIGYDRDIRLVLDDDRPVRAVVSSRPGWQSVQVRGRHLTVPGHLTLDLGATAKAVAADLVANEIARRLGCGVLLSLGGDIATAGPEPADGWHVTVQDIPGEPAGQVHVRARAAVATSSTLRRRWLRGGEQMHHILDPRTGRPAAPVWRTVSVAASSCFLANSFATAAIVHGATAPEWLAQRAPARLVDQHGRVITVGGWPAEAAADHDMPMGVRHG